MAEFGSMPLDEFRKHFGLDEPKDLCNHCGQPPDDDGDHSCPCPCSDEECPHHQT